MRLVNADEIRKKAVPHTRGDHGYSADIRKWAVLVGDIDDAPTIDAVPVKRGTWKLNKDGSGTCDQCHFTQKAVWDFDGWQNFCGVCGADMRERKDGEG